MIRGYSLISLILIIAISYTSVIRASSFGGITIEDPTKDIYHQLAKDSLSQYLEENNSEPYTVLLVVKATEQVVSGTLTRLDFLASYLCKPHSKGQNPSNCQPENVYKVLKCHAKILNQLWINLRETAVNCTSL